MGCAVELRDVWKLYGRVEALRGASACIPEGLVTVVLGPNGAGKTTMFRVASGAARPSRGVVRVLGVDASRERLRVKGLVGVMPEQPSLFPELRVADALRIVCRLRGLRECSIEEYLDTVFPKERLRDRYAGLSRGLKRRADLLASLLGEPRVLLLDEPTAGLDVGSAQAVRDIILGLRGRGRTVVMSTHNIAEARVLADYLVVLRRGRVVMEGPVRDVLSRLPGGLRARIVLRGEPPGEALARLMVAFPSVERRGRTVVVELRRPLRDLERLVRELRGLEGLVESLTVEEAAWEELARAVAGRRGGGGCRCPSG